MVSDEKRCILLIADGLGDRPVEKLGGKTPLEYAQTPTLDELVREGMCGLVHPCSPGVRCGTDYGHLCLFGYDPEPFYTGRGSIEAYSAGMILEKGDIAFRGNFATVSDELKVVDRRAGRIADEKDIKGLIDEISDVEIDGCKVIVRSLTEHRLALVLRGAHLSGGIPDTDPGTAREGEAVVRPDLALAGQGGTARYRTAEILWKCLERIHDIWEKSPINKARAQRGLLPANFILTRGCGEAMVLPPFTAKYPGARVAVIAGDDTITGIGRMCGFDAYKKPGFTGGFDTDHMGKARLAYELSSEYDLVIVHVKGTDLCGHDDLPEKKAEIIERIDEMFAYWRSQKSEREYYYAMEADHSTPCAQREHSADPVPAFFTGPGVRRDKVKTYGETECAGGMLDQYTGAQVMAVIMDHLCYNKKRGA